MEQPYGGAGDGAGALDQKSEAIEFVRFCHRRKHVGWPELYDEMCAVAGRGLYRGLGPEELGEIGIGFGLFEMPALAGLVATVLGEEAERRRRAADELRPSVVLAAKGRGSIEPSSDAPASAAAMSDDGLESAGVIERSAPEPMERPAQDVPPIRMALAAGA
jgi:hypothetical protein